MHANRNKLTIAMASLTASGLLMFAVPSGTSAAVWRPPMPCVAVRAGVYALGSGFCPATTGGPDWHQIARQLGRAAGDWGITT